MAISFSKYVNIVSSVAGAPAVSTRELIARVFSTNPLLPTETVVQFTSSDDVKLYFGAASEEYKRAAFYFDWISKKNRRPQKISYQFWAQAATAPLIYGLKGTYAVGDFTGIAAGKFDLTLGALTHEVTVNYGAAGSLADVATVTQAAIRATDVATAPTITGAAGIDTLTALHAVDAGALTITLAGDAEELAALDFSGAADFDAVAGILQAAIRAAHIGALWTAATVTYDVTRQAFNFTGGAIGAATIVVADGAQAPAAALGWTAGAVLMAGLAAGTHPVWSAATVAFDAVRGSFQLTGGAAGPAVIAVADGDETPAAALGWTAGATLSDGVAAEAIADTLANSVTASNNFGLFCFTRAAALTLQNVKDAATWNEEQNVSFQFSVGVTAANATAWSAALIATPGVELTLIDPTGYPNEFDEMAPACILAATDYNARGAAQNYMYQLFPALTPKVSGTTTSNTYDGLRVNYYGATQEAGNLLSFYQRGTMMGGITSPLDMNIYANEMWFKDAAAAAIMNLLIAVPEIPINPKGRGLLNGALQPVIALAVLNGTVSVGKDLSALQIAVIGELTGDDKAWRQVQTIGYWLSIDFESYVTDDNRTEWKAVYALVYSKDDVVRKVEGTHALI